MSPVSRKEYAQAIAKRYHEANRDEKSSILDEFRSATTYDGSTPRVELKSPMKGSFLFHGTLADLTVAQLRTAFEPEIFRRGLAYYREGAVSRLKQKPNGFVTRVSGSRSQPYAVDCTVFPRNELYGFCSCPFMRDWENPCKHLAAALLAWIEQRYQGSAEPQWNASNSEDAILLPGISSDRGGSPDDRAEAAPFRPKLRPFLRGAPLNLGETSELSRRHGFPLAPMFTWDFFGQQGSLQAVVTIADVEAGRSLRVAITGQKDERRAVFWIPRERIPDFLAQCRSAPDFVWEGAAADLRLHDTFVRPCLSADYDDRERLMLRPHYTLRVRRGEPDRVWELQDIRDKQVGRGAWIWEKEGVYPIAPVPALLRPYFSGKKPLMYERLEIPSFLHDAYPLLLREVAFRPASSVRSTRLLPAPRLAHVRLTFDGPDWLSCHPVYLAADVRLALDEILSAQAEGDYLRRGGDWIALPEKAALQEAWADAQPDEKGAVRLTRLQYLKARAAWEPRAVRVEEDDAVRDFRERIDRVRPLRDPPPMRGLTSVLRPYQEAGYRWLWSMLEMGFGALLADEMGLGKTHQALAVLTALQETEGSLPSLIVCPRTVTDHWEDKLERYAPGLRCVRMHGLSRSIPEVFSTSGTPAIILTTYALLARQAALFESIEWKCVVLDEAQSIKNPQTKAAQAARRLCAGHRIALSGTPLENRPAELWSVFQFLMPGYLGSAQSFRRCFERPIVERGDSHAAARLGRLIHPFKLRRLKADVLQELPAKIEDVRWCELTPHQIALYREVIERAEPMVRRLKDPSRPIDYIHIFATLTRLKRICDHPALVLSAAKSKSLTSGKLEVFLELLEEILATDRKVVVFSQYLEMLDMLAGILKKRKIGYIGLRGDTRDRRSVVAAFQRDPDRRVFLGSLLAGGLGIDLTSASIVIHYDRWWNAAREDQATDRVHRIGQMRGVQVFKLVTRGTLEERIDRMIARKRALMESIVGADTDTVKQFTREELIDLLSVSPSGL